MSFFVLSYVRHLTVLADDWHFGAVQQMLVDVSSLDLLLAPLAIDDSLHANVVVHHGIDLGDKDLAAAKGTFNLFTNALILVSTNKLLIGHGLTAAAAYHFGIY